jgi:hypothetical protein
MTYFKSEILIAVIGGLIVLFFGIIVPAIYRLFREWKVDRYYSMRLRAELVRFRSEMESYLERSDDKLRSHFNVKLQLNDFDHLRSRYFDRHKELDYASELLQIKQNVKDTFRISVAGEMSAEIRHHVEIKIIRAIDDFLRTNL